MRSRQVLRRPDSPARRHASLLPRGHSPSAIHCVSRMAIPGNLLTAPLSRGAGSGTLAAPAALHRWMPPRAGASLHRRARAVGLSERAHTPHGVHVTPLAAAATGTHRGCYQDEPSVATVWCVDDVACAKAPAYYPGMAFRVLIYLLSLSQSPLQSRARTLAAYLGEYTGNNE